ncbi:hypothetical protein [Spartinivicinus ruber]|uniref:hypothetical protein n=1 Tax=Spartinivicinus ruber TaxID=2683272 RepID=UPI0013D21F32|nr:hypothetical protein [Spartinivicinus ruber]
MNREAAKLIIEALEENNKLLPILEADCQHDEYEKLKREIARVATDIDKKLYPLVLGQYPDLDPLKDK